MTEFIKACLIPGSKWFLLFGLSFGVLMLYGRGALSRIGRLWLVFLTVSYWLLTLPVVSDRMAGAFDRKQQAPAAKSAPGAAAIVVLGAGTDSYMADGFLVTVPLEQTALNAFAAARLYQSRPMPIIASGGLADPRTGRQPESEILRDILTRSGVRPGDIILESFSTTTHEQAVMASSLLKNRHSERFALVTAPVHLLRAAASFRAQGVDPIPVAAEFRSDQTERSEAPWLPSSVAWKASEIAMYDYIGWVSYWYRGWLRGAPEQR